MAKDLFEQAYSHFDYSYNRLVIYYFFNCQCSQAWSPDYDYINETYRKLVSESQLEDFIQNITEKYTKANCFKELANQILEVNNKKNYGIDFTSFSINILDYAEP